MKEGFSLDEAASRLERLQLIAKKADPYGQSQARSHHCQQVRDDFAALAAEGKDVRLAGRITTLRKHGGSLFADLRDESGSLQLYFKKDRLSAADFSFINNLVDRGDFIEVTGKLFKTKKDVPTLEVSQVLFLAKALLPLPEKWHGLSDTELRYRQRYLDLLVNPRSMDALKCRSVLLQHIRRYFDEKNFLEVETPILQPLAGGATARPFITHHNSLDIDMYLRIAPELYLKRLLVGGFEKVYEIARCFRNEGIDQNHNPEFTQIEWYQAYMNYQELMSFTEQMLLTVVQATIQSDSIKYQNHAISFVLPFERLTFRSALQKYVKLDMEDYKDVEKLRLRATELGLKLDGFEGRGKILDELFKKFVRPRCIQPTFITDHPLELSPLARQHNDQPDYVQRFQIVLGGEIELCNGFSELNDPLEQERRFQAQEELRSAGDDEAQRFDHDYVTALKYGMPPAAGCGLGIDRLAALLSSSASIKEVLAFPTMRPKDPSIS